MKYNAQKVFVGDRFDVRGGWCEVIEYINHGNVVVRFDRTGSIRTTRADCLTKGKLIDLEVPRFAGVGFIGTGPCDSRSHPTEYKMWCRMLNRCYWRTTKPYHDCTVDSRWHSFQNFCSDVANMTYEHGWQLDKDLLSVSGKVYSKDTCVFLPQILNNQFLCKPDNGLPEGVSRVFKKTARYVAMLGINGKNNYLGVYDTPEEAHAVYCAAKLNRLLELVEEYRDKLEQRAYAAFIRKAVATYGKQQTEESV